MAVKPIHRFSREDAGEDRFRLVLLRAEADVMDWISHP